MTSVIGIFIVFGSIICGYLMHNGNLHVLFQPSEFIIIIGAGFGSLLVMASPKLLKKIAAAIPTVFKRSPLGKTVSLEYLGLLYEMLTRIKRDGVLAVERDVEYPSESPMFKKYPSFLASREATSLLCDTMRLILLGASIRPHDLDELMSVEIESYEENEGRVSGIIMALADAFPGLGIVAAVLGVIVTMGRMNESPEIIGHSVAAALVGTFLGVLLCYGVVGPMAKKLEHEFQLERRLLEVIKATLLAFAKDIPPRIAVEFGRRVLLEDEKPEYREVETYLNSKKTKS